MGWMGSRPESAGRAGRVVVVFDKVKKGLLFFCTGYGEKIEEPKRFPSSFPPAAS